MDSFNMPMARRELLARFPTSTKIVCCLMIGVVLTRSHFARICCNRSSAKIRHLQTQLKITSPSRENYSQPPATAALDSTRHRSVFTTPIASHTSQRRQLQNKLNRRSVV